MPSWYKTPGKRKNNPSIRPQTEPKDSRRSQKWYKTTQKSLNLSRIRKRCKKREEERRRWMDKNRKIPQNYPKRTRTAQDMALQRSCIIQPQPQLSGAELHYPAAAASVRIGAALSSRGRSCQDRSCIIQPRPQLSGQGTDLVDQLGRVVGYCPQVTDHVVGQRRRALQAHLHRFAGQVIVQEAGGEGVAGADR